MNFKLRLDLLEIRLVEESRSVLVLLEKSLQRVTKHMPWEKMLTTYSMSLLNLERKKLMTKMILTDLEMV